MNNKQVTIYKIREKRSGKYISCFPWNRTSIKLDFTGKQWRTQSTAIRRLVLFLSTLTSAELLEPRLEEYELVSFKIIEQEDKIINSSELIKQEIRLKFISDNYSSSSVELFTKLVKSDLLEFRYIIFFIQNNNWTINKKAAKELKQGLRDMDIKRGVDYRYTETAFAFRDCEHAMLARLSCSDEAATNVIDLEKLEELNVNE